MEKTDQLEQILLEVQTIFRDVFDDAELALRRETSAADIEGWDSLAQMTLVSAIAKKFEVKFKIDEIVHLKNVGDMVDLIERKRNVMNV